MRLQPIASSSSGNCYFLKGKNDSLLLECGLPLKKIKKALDFKLTDIRGCLVSHSHKDHSFCAKDIMGSAIDLYTGKDTAKELGLSGYRLRVIDSLKQFRVGEFNILPFPIQHDVPGFGFLIANEMTGEKLVYATDTFYVRNRFQRVNYFLVECNYCLDILKANVAAGLVDEALKNRILQSHFSLANLKDFLIANVTSDTRKIVLIHLSDDNSNAARMQREIEELTRVETVVADPGMEIPLDLYPF